MKIFIEILTKKSLTTADNNGAYIVDDWFVLLKSNKTL